MLSDPLFFHPSVYSFLFETPTTSYFGPRDLSLKILSLGTYGWQPLPCTIQADEFEELDIKEKPAPKGLKGWLFMSMIWPLIRRWLKGSRLAVFLPEGFQYYAWGHG
jgi:hypothetical protein